MTGFPPTTPPPEQPPATWPGAPSRTQRFGVDLGRVLTTRWGRGALAAVVVFASLFLLSLLLTVLQAYGPESVEFMGQRVPVPDVSFTDQLYAALSAIYLWQGVGVSIDLEGALGGQAGIPAGALAVSGSFSLILGTFVVVMALFAAGRWMSRDDDAPLWARPLRGLQVALPYAVLCALLSLVAGEGGIPGLSEGFSQGFPQGGGAPFPGGMPEINFSLFGAFAMPFLIALIAAGAGATGVAARAATGLVRRAVAAFAGGWRMLWLSVALAVVGFLIVAAANPEPTRAYLEFVSQDGALGVIRGVLLTAFLLGNVGVYVAAASAGVPIGVSALGGNCTLISYLNFPAGTTEAAAGAAADFANPCAALPIQFETAPAVYLLFLLVPLVATVLGGRLAARRAGATVGSEGAAVGAVAGFVFALLSFLFAWLADVSYEVEFFFQVEASAGPSLPLTFLLTMLWGLVGGAIGGWLGSRRTAAPTGETGLGPGTAEPPKPGTTVGPG